MASLVVQLSPQTAESLRSTLLHGTEPATEHHVQLAQVLNNLGVTLTPMDTSSKDPSVRSFFHTVVPATQIESVTHQLRNAAAVQTVFVKPDDALP
jgi:hypothetical protein